MYHAVVFHLAFEFYYKEKITYEKNKMPLQN